MIPQTRTHLRRDRTPNRKYIENNLYEIHKRLKQNENKPLAKPNSLIKPPKRTENEPKTSKKQLRSVKNEPNRFLNLKLAPANFITKQRAQKSVDYQRAQILELDSNQNIVDQLNFPKFKGTFAFSAKKNDKTKLEMASDVLFALGLVPVSQSSSSEKMHLLEEEEEEGGGGGGVVTATKSEGDTMTSLVGGVTSMPSPLLRNKNGGVTNGDLPETPPSDMDEEEKEEELADSIAMTNGEDKPPTDPLQQEEEEGAEQEGNTSTVDEKQAAEKKVNGDKRDEKEGEECGTAGDEKIDLSTTEKCETSSILEAEEEKKIEKLAETSTVKDADENQKEEIKAPSKNFSPDKCQSNKKEIGKKSNPTEEDLDAKDQDKEGESKNPSTNIDEKDTDDKINPSGKDTKDKDVREENRTKNDGDNGGTNGKDPEIEEQSGAKTTEDTKVSSPDPLKTTEGTSKDELEIVEEPAEDPLENTLDEKDGILKIGGKVVELAPSPEPVPRDDKQSFDEFMLANNMEITICKTPSVGGGEIGNLRRSSSGSSKGRSLSPSNDQVNVSSNASGRTQSNGGGKLTGQTLLDGTVSPALSVDGSRTSVSEAELMLASVSDGEITITKSCGGSLDGRSVDGRSVDGRSVDGGRPSEGGGKSELRMMRRSDLKRSLSSEVWRGEESGGGGGGSGGDGEEVESKRAHLSRSEEMVTEEYEPDLTEPLDGDEDERERLVRDFVTQASASLGDSLAKLKREIHVLSELAQAKELEWNSLLRLRKLKEEMWERLSRKVRVESLFSNKRRPSTSVSPSLPPKCSKPSPSSSPSASQPPTSPSLKTQRLILPKPTAQLSQPLQSPVANTNTEIILAEGRQGKIKDVQAIINDYRSKTANEANSLSNPANKIRSRRSSLNNAANNQATLNNSSASHNNNNNSSAARSYAGNPSLLSMANLALGSGGGQVRSGSNQQNVVHQMQQQQQQQLDVQLNYLGNVQVQRHSQVKGQSMPLPPVAQSQFPEVTLHPVLPSPTQQQNSLLHGILTKTPGKHQQSSPQLQQQQQQQAPSSSHPSSGLPVHLAPPRSPSFSPTLARLLTLPERQRAAHNAGGPGGFSALHNVGPANFSATQNLSAMLRAQKVRGTSVSGPPCSNDIVASLKQKIVPQQNRHQQQQQQQQQLHQSEITITPVSCVQLGRKEDSVVNLDDEDENDRLVIDETRTNDPSTGNPSGATATGGLSNGGGDTIPECQGCHRNSAQFVCAGCGNQWYCSRECQVSAWEDHSDVCSG